MVVKKNEIKKFRCVRRVKKIRRDYKHADAAVFFFFEFDVVISVKVNIYSKVVGFRGANVNIKPTAAVE